MVVTQPPAGPCSANTICLPNAGLMLAHRLRRWPYINPSTGQHIVSRYAGRHIIVLVDFGPGSFNLVYLPGPDKLSGFIMPRIIAVSHIYTLILVVLCGLTLQESGVFEYGITSLLL